MVVLPERSGAPEARNAGAWAVHEDWTALLDDEWSPEKLAVQLSVSRARASQNRS